jgi:hypothetical protein
LNLRLSSRALEDVLGQRIAFAKKAAVVVKLACLEPTICNPADYRLPKYMDVYFYPKVGDLSQRVPMPLYFVRRVVNTKLEPVRMAIEGTDFERRPQLIEIKKAFPSKNWRVESALGDFKGNLPAPDKRPNAWTAGTAGVSAGIRTRARRCWRPNGAGCKGLSQFSSGSY